MFIGVSIGVKPFYSPLVDEIVLGYVARVTANGGVYEGLACLEDKLNKLR